MSSAIWDSGPVAASVCCSTCERCAGALRQCVQLIVIATDARITLCLSCFAVLCIQSGRVSGAEDRRILCR